MFAHTHDFPQVRLEEVLTFRSRLPFGAAFHKMTKVTRVVSRGLSRLRKRSEFDTVPLGCLRETSGVPPGVRRAVHAVLYHEAVQQFASLGRKNESKGLIILAFVARSEFTFHGFL